MADRRTRIAIAIYNLNPASQPWNGDPYGFYERGARFERKLAERQADAVLAVLSAVGPAELDVLAGVLGTLFHDRGNDIREWPEDEAEAYRELGWEPGRAAARDLVNRKGAQALFAAGYFPTTGRV